MVYRNKVHHGEHEPIVDRALFDAVQAKLAAGAGARRMRLRGSPAILTGRIFDDRGNRMTPSHTNKGGARYRYYVSHAVLQKRHGEAGTVSRVPAPNVESMVIKTLRDRNGDAGSGGGLVTDDRDLIEHHVDRVIIHPQTIEVHLLGKADGEEQTQNRDGIMDDETGSRSPSTITVSWSAMPAVKAKGILHSPSPTNTMTAENRDVLLSAIAKARAWVDDLVQGRSESFAQIAEREGKVERHVRFLAPLAFVSPQIVSAIIDGTAPADLTVTDLAKSLPHSWIEQEQKHEIPNA